MLRPLLRPLLSKPLSIHSPRTFSLFPSSTSTPQNRIYDTIRTPADLHTLLLLCAANNRPLISLWTASYCSTCATISPIVRRLIEQERVGESEGGLGYVEVGLDGVLIGDLGVTYRVSGPHD